MDNMNHRPLVIMLAKPPLAGRVKTRLAVDGALSPAAAAGFYAACVADLTARLAGAPDYALVVCGPPGLDAAERQSLTDLLPAGVRLIEEPVSGRPPRDLGRIMEDVAFTCLGSETTRVALIGSDCALLTPDRVRAAFAALDEADLVLGPDGGGGCYLIGLRRRLPILTGPAAFGPVAWSQGTDYGELSRRAEALGIPLAVVATERDVDRPADLDWLRQRLASCPAAAATAPRMAAWLAREWVEGKR